MWTEQPDSKVREQAQMALDAAEKWKLVEKNTTELSDDEESWFHTHFLSGFIITIIHIFFFPSIT